MDDAGYCGAQRAGSGRPRGGIFSVAIADEVLARDVTWNQEADHRVHPVFGLVTCWKAERYAFGFPHWDSRIGRGQRSTFDESTAVLFVNTDLAASGDSAQQLPP